MHRLPVLWFVDGVVVVDAGLLLDNLRLGAGAGHGAAEEDVDEEHDPEQDPEGDAEVGQPVGVGRSWWRGCKVYSTVVKFCSSTLSLVFSVTHLFFLKNESKLALIILKNE